MNQNKNLILKIALLSTCLVSASLNAVTGLVPEMAAAFPTVPLSTIELIATVPSLFQMVGVLGEQIIAKKLGHKGAMLLGLLFCAVGGIIPIFLPLFPVIFVTRCFFGTGCGLLMSSLLTLVVAFFDGRTRSNMIGLNGGISGVGSALATFAAGLLLAFGWNMSFAVYFLGFAVLALVLVFVPKVKAAAPAGSAEKKTGKIPLGLWGLGALMFVSVMLATMYVIKASTLITEYGYGTAKEGSLAITILSLGSFAAGLTYGSLRVKLKKHTLTLAFAICAAGFLLGGFANSLAMVWAGAFLLGYGYLIFMPYLQDQASRSYGAYGETATNLVLVFQSVGAFVTPWLGNLFGLASEDLKVQFFMTAACFILLTAGSILLMMEGFMIKRIISVMISFALLLTGSACAAAEGSPEDSAASVTVSSTLEESSTVESQAVALLESGAFIDVTPGDWFYGAVEYCRENGLMSGKGASRFAPNDNMTRAELAMVLYSHAQSPAVTAVPDFTDVKPDAWYTNAVAWAQENKIVSGYGDSRFGTNDNVRREDIATIFWHYAGSPEAGEDAEFADMAQVSGYALKAIDWARANGIVSGKGNNRFDPKGYATRAEVAAMMMNFSRYDPDVPPSPGPDGTKALVAYFSATGNTRPLAEYAAEHLGADIYEITPQEPYTKEDLAYYTDCRADREQNDPSARPAISGGVGDMGRYDVVFIGYPIWHGQAPRIISTFLESYDLTGKTIVPFCTSGSSGIGSSATNLHDLTDGAEWLDGRRFASGTSREEIEGWIDSLDLPDTAAALPYDGIYPQHEPMGEGIGAMPGRVVWAHDPASVSWDGSGYWWELSHFDEAAIQSMVDESIAQLGGKTTPQEGWEALFAYRSEGGYRSGEKIAIKANINGSAVMDDDTSGETAMSYTNPVLLKALLTSLVKDAGVAPADITVYDVSRLFPDYMVEMCTQGGLQGVNFVGRSNGAADENAPIVWSHEFSGRVNYLPTCVTEAKYVINLANLKGHSYGITLCGKNHFGSFINGNAMRPPEGANLHQWLTRNEMGIYSPLTDLMANADLGGKTVLYMLDALICAPSEGASITKENATWQQEPFDGGFTASVLVSQDPVAIDSVGADFLSNEPTVTQYNRAAASANNENYLHEAGLVGKAPSGTAYTDSQGHTVTNLGVHEHWNNSTEKKYSRNRDEKEGIELIEILK